MIFSHVHLKLNMLIPFFRVDFSEMRKWKLHWQIYEFWKWKKTYNYIAINDERDTWK